MCRSPSKAAAWMRGLCGFVMICLGVPWLPSLCATDYIYHPLYKVYSNDVVAIDVGAESQGWAIFFMAPIPKQVWLNTRHAQGSYPGGLALAIKHDHVVDPEPFLDCDYTVTSHTLTGTISAAAVKQTPVTTYTVTMHNHLETYINDSHGAEDNWVLQEVTDDQLTYNHHFYCDDFADGPADATHVGTLAVQTTWSANNGWVEGHLHAEESWDAWNHMPADVDVVRLATGVGVYCVETDKEFIDFSGAALAITVFKKKAGKDEYDGEYIARTNKFNVYSDNGYLDNARQRVYFTLDNDNGAYVQISLADPVKASKYKVRVFRARPVILVHGIECYPKSAARDLPLGRNAMGHWNDYLPWDALAYPCVCTNLCWDSKVQDLTSTGAGVLGTILTMVNDEENTHKMPVVLIGHSMGGYFVRLALSKAPTYLKIHKAVTLGTPHFGSDVANCIPIGGAAVWFKQTSRANLFALQRGSAFVWAMREWGGLDKLLCMAGAGAPPRIASGKYVRGLGESDGVVPVSSGLLIGAAQNTAIRIADHGTIALATYVPRSCYPYDTSPAGFVGVSWERVFGNDQNAQRLPAHVVLGDADFSRIYRPVREYIK